MYRQNEEEPLMLHPISDNDYAELQKHKNTVNMKLKFEIE